jgi:hypothetical protein
VKFFSRGIKATMEANKFFLHAVRSSIGGGGEVSFREWRSGKILTAI